MKTVVLARRKSDRDTSKSYVVGEEISNTFSVSKNSEIIETKGGRKVKPKADELTFEAETFFKSFAEAKKAIIDPADEGATMDLHLAILSTAEEDTKDGKVPHIYTEGVIDSYSIDGGDTGVGGDLQVKYTMKTTRGTAHGSDKLPLEVEEFIKLTYISTEVGGNVAP